MGLSLYPKCPDCGTETGNQYKFNVAVIGDSNCRFCKAKLVPRFNQQWPLRIALALIASGMTQLAFANGIFGFAVDDGIVSAISIIFALVAIRVVDCFVQPKSFGRL